MAKRRIIVSWHHHPYQVMDRMANGKRVQVALAVEQLRKEFWLVDFYFGFPADFCFHRSLIINTKMFSRDRRVGWIECKRLPWMCMSWKRLLARMDYGTVVDIFTICDINLCYNKTSHDDLASLIALQCSLWSCWVSFFSKLDKSKGTHN